MDDEKDDGTSGTPKGRAPREGTPHGRAHQGDTPQNGVGYTGEGRKVAGGKAATSGNLVTRPYIDDDREALLALWQACYPDRSPDTLAARLTRFLEDREVLIQLGCRDGRLIGAAVAGLCGGRGWVHDVAVLPTMRLQGLGRHLVRGVESWLRRHRGGVMHVLLPPEARLNSGFFQRIGYEAAQTQLWRRVVGQAQDSEAEVPRLRLVVTFLEMDEPPRRAPASKPAARLALMQAHKPSPAFYRFLYETVGRPWLWTERQGLSDPDLTALIHHPAVAVHVLYVEGVPAGFTEFEWREEGELHIAYFGLMPDYIGRGFGPYFLDWVIDAAWNSQPRPQKLTLNTCNFDHPKALALYQKAGFRPVRQKQGWIDDPRYEGRRNSLLHHTRRPDHNEE